MLLQTFPSFFIVAHPQSQISTHTIVVHKQFVGKQCIPPYNELTEIKSILVAGFAVAASFIKKDIRRLMAVTSLFDFEIPRVAEFINNGAYCRTCLQFGSQELLSHAQSIVTQLKALIDTHFQVQSCPFAHCIVSGIS